MKSAIGTVSENSARLWPRLLWRRFVPACADASRRVPAAAGGVSARTAERLARGAGSLGIEVSKVPQGTFLVTLPLVRTGNSRSYCPDRATPARLALPEGGSRT